MVKYVPCTFDAALAAYHIHWVAGKGSHIPGFYVVCKLSIGVSKHCNLRIHPAAPSPQPNPLLSMTSAI